jgi:hypothetical protein
LYNARCLYYLIFYLYVISCCSITLPRHGWASPKTWLGQVLFFKHRQKAQSETELGSIEFVETDHVFAYVRFFIPDAAGSKRYVDEG